MAQQRTRRIVFFPCNSVNAGSMGAKRWPVRRMWRRMEQYGATWSWARRTLCPRNYRSSIPDFRDGQRHRRTDSDASRIFRISNVSTWRARERWGRVMGLSEPLPAQYSRKQQQEIHCRWFSPNETSDDGRTSRWFGVSALRSPMEIQYWSVKNVMASTDTGIDRTHFHSRCYHSVLLLLQ